MDFVVLNKSLCTAAHVVADVAAVGGTQPEPGAGSPPDDRASAVRLFTPREEYRPRHRAEVPVDPLGS